MKLIDIIKIQSLKNFKSRPVNNVIINNNIMLLESYYKYLNNKINELRNKKIVILLKYFNLKEKTYDNYVSLGGDKISNSIERTRDNIKRTQGLMVSLKRYLNVRNNGVNIVTPKLMEECMEYILDNQEKLNTEELADGLLNLGFNLSIKDIKKQFPRTNLVLSWKNLYNGTSECSLPYVALLLSALMTDSSIYGEFNSFIERGDAYKYFDKYLYSKKRNKIR